MEVEFFFDFSCPYAYLGSSQIEAVCSQAGATVVWKPMLLGGVFRAVGTAQNMGAGMPPAKARHNLLDMHRWAALWDVPFALPAAHPMRTVAALRALLALPEARWPMALHAIYHSYWVLGQDISQPAVIRSALLRAGESDEAIEAALAANDDEEIKTDLRRRTDEAIERGVFGAPAMFIDGELFWGQDRLALLAKRLGTTLSATAPEKTEGDAVIDFYYDFSSPFAYLGSTQIERVAREAGATLRWRPFLLGAVFKSIGTANVPILAFSDAKRRYYRDDLHRAAADAGVGLNWNSHFPLRTVGALRLALLAGEDRIAPLSHAIFKALWVEGLEPTNDLLETIAESVGLDPKLVAETQRADVKQRLFSETNAAIERGVFGAPTMIVSSPSAEDELFWGQDRLEMTRDAARGWHPKLAVASP